MKIFSRQFPIKRTNSRGHTTIIEGLNLFGPKSSFHVLKKNASFNECQVKVIQVPHDYYVIYSICSIKLNYIQEKST